MIPQAALMAEIASQMWVLQTIILNQEIGNKPNQLHRPKT